MLRLWRLYRAAYGPGLDGAGGAFADGRWHRQGKRVVYFGATPAIVVLERLAHLDPDLLPDDLRLGCFEFGKTIHPANVGEGSGLPENWTVQETLTRELGTLWLQESSACLLSVPSALLPEEWNYVFNPQHSDAEYLQRVSERPFSFDARLL